MNPPLAVKCGHIELAQPLRVAEDIDFRDLPAPDRDGHDREQLSFQHDDQAGCAVDERRAPSELEVRVREREGVRLTSHVLGTADLDHACTDVASEHDLRVEDSDEPAEVTVLGSRAKGVEDPSLNLYVGVNSGLARLKTAAGAASKLASRVRGALDNGCNLVEWHAEDIVQHERDAFGRRKGVEHNEHC